jgi:hypothetical protein
MARRRQRTAEAPPQLGPEDDPYVAYLLWRAERDAAEAADAPETEVPERGPVLPATRSSWVRRLAVWHRNAGR